MKKEYILCAAVHYDDGIFYSQKQAENIAQGRVYTGYRHDRIINNVGMDKLHNKGVKKIQGFMTSRERFVDRKEAAEIALKSGQIPELHYTANELFSEDLY